MRFYVLGDLRIKDRTYDASVVPLKPHHQGIAPACPLCGSYVGMLPWLLPYHAEITVYGSKLGDMAESVGDSWLVSGRFRYAWEMEGLRGINEFSPLTRLRVRPTRLGRPPPTYFHIAPHYFGTKIDFERSLIDYSRGGDCSHCHAGIIDCIRRIIINESSWTGEDIFVAWGVPGSLIVTDRVREMRDKYELTNMNMTPVEEYLWDPLHQWTPFCQYPFGSYDLANPTGSGGNK